MKIILRNAIVLNFVQYMSVSHYILYFPEYNTSILSF